MKSSDKKSINCRQCNGDGKTTYTFLYLPQGYSRGRRKIISKECDNCKDTGMEPPRKFYSPPKNEDVDRYNHVEPFDPNGDQGFSPYHSK